MTRTPFRLLAAAYLLLACSAIAMGQASFEVLHVFMDTPDGSNSESTLLQASDGSFYGTTAMGGDNGLGTIFQATADGTVNILHSFTGGDDGGAEPFSGLVLGADGNFYGTTLANSLDSEGIFEGPGTVFVMQPDGGFNVLHAFNGADGSRPNALLQASDGTLYGTTHSGGAFHFGTIFHLTLDGMFTVLHDFTSADGNNPEGALIQASDGNFYGVTEQGGTFNRGVVFQMTPDGALTVLYEFTCGVDGCEPGAALLQASDGFLYGTTHFGNSFDGGSAFRISFDGTLEVLHQFGDGIDAAFPFAALIQAADGNFYGTSLGGGQLRNRGTVFQMTPDGTVTVLHEFDGTTDGIAGFAGLLQASDGNFYGVSGATVLSGEARNGVFFRLAVPSAANLPLRPPW